MLFKDIFGWWQVRFLNEIHKPWTDIACVVSWSGPKTALSWDSSSKIVLEKHKQWLWVQNKLHTQIVTMHETSMFSGSHCHVGLRILAERLNDWGHFSNPIHIPSNKNRQLGVWKAQLSLRAIQISDTFPTTPRDLTSSFAASSHFDSAEQLPGGPSPALSIGL